MNDSTEWLTLTIVGFATLWLLKKLFSKNKNQDQCHRCKKSIQYDTKTNQKK